MTIQPHHQTAHPQWCDPRLCTTDPGASVEHRDAPLTWVVIADDYAASIGLARIDCLDRPSVGPVHVRLGVHGTDCLDENATTDLTPDDARMLAAALVSAARRAEQPVVGAA